MLKSNGWDWYKQYPKKYIGGILGMGPAMIGAYSVILNLIYEDGEAIPNDPAWLGGIMGCSGRQARGLVDGLIKRGKIYIGEDGRLRNMKADAVLNDRETKTRQHSDAGTTGGKRSADARARIKKYKELAEARLNTLEKEKKNKTEKKKVSKGGAHAPAIPGLEFPPWWPMEAWQGFVESRKKMGHPLSDRAIKLSVEKLVRANDNGENVPALIDKATLRGWRGIFTKEDDDSKNQAAATPAENIAEWVARLEVFHHGRPEDDIDAGFDPGHWRGAWGPTPGQPGCRAPAEAITEFRRRHPPKKVG